MCAAYICVLYAQHDVVVGAGAGVLTQQSSSLEQRRLACHCYVSCPPCLTVVGRQADAGYARAVPDLLLWPVKGKRRHVTGCFRND